MSHRLGDLRMDEYLEALGSSAPTPGGGSAAAVSGALASALGRMVISVAQDKEPSPERAELAIAFRDLGQRFLALAADDELAFAQVMDALRMPRDAAERPARLQAALEQAAAVPAQAAQAGVDVLRRLADAEPHASRAIVSDIGVGAHLALAAVRSSLLNIAVNVRAIQDLAVADRLSAQADALRAAAEAAHALVVGRVEERLARKRA